MLGGGSFPRRSTGFLVRPRLGGSLRNYLRPTEVTRPPRKPRTRKAGGPHKMELRKRTPDYTDIAYREAVARLRYLLAESYSPHSSPAKSSQIHRGDDSGDEIESVALSERSRHQHHHHFLPSYRVPLYGSKRTLFADPPAKLTHTHSIQNLPAEATDTTTKPEGPMPPPELMAFIERQEEYIEQLEKESQYCRDELSALLGKVKEVISENEGLHEREKAGLLKSVFDCFEDEDDQEMDSDGKSDKQKSQQSKKKRLEGPSIVFESRISELEAQLTQTKMDLRKALEEAELYKKKLSDQPLGFETSGGMSGDCSSHRQQIENLQREKDELHENVVKLQAALSQFREKEADATLKVKRSLDVVDQAHFEKAQVGVENEEQTVESDVAKVGKEKNEVGEESAREQKTQEEKQPTSEELVVTEAQADIEVAHLDVMGHVTADHSNGSSNPVEKFLKVSKERRHIDIVLQKASQEELRHRIRAAVAKVSHDMLERVWEDWITALISAVSPSVDILNTCKAELEVRRLKEELDRQHEKMRELMQEQGRKVQDERLQLERRYTQQMEQLSTDLTSQWDSSSKLQLELEKQRRVEADLRRDLQQKTVTIEELKKELQNKISSLQTELVQAAVERGSLEQELAASRLAIERAERDGRQEISRLQAEVAALRQRLDRADADVIHSRRENLRLTEQIASLEREVNLAKLTKDSNEATSPQKQKSEREKELAAMVMDMEAKHVHTVAELEGMIQSQNQVMEKLKQECHSLTEKLEESSTRHKRERVSLRQENVMLMDKLERLWEVQKQKTTLTPETPPRQDSMNSTTLMNKVMNTMHNTNMTLVDSSTNRNLVNYSSSTNQQLSNNSNSTRQIPANHSSSIDQNPDCHSSLNPIQFSHSSTKLNPPNNNSSTNPNPPNHSSSTNPNPPNHSSSTNPNLPNHNSSPNPKTPNPSNTNPNPRHRSSISRNLDNLNSVRVSKQRRRRPHLSLSPRRREVVETLPPPAPLTLEDLATDSDSSDSPSSQLGIFRTPS